MRTLSERYAIKERKGKEIKGNKIIIKKERNSKERKKIITPPTIEEIKNYCQERNNDIDAERFFDFYTSKGWLIGKNKMKDWRAAIRTWEKRNQTTKTIKENLEKFKKNFGNIN